MKIIKYISVLALVFSLFACKHEEANLFDASAQERLIQFRDEAKGYLTAAPYGWKMAYDPAGRKCFRFLIQFKADNTVTMRSDFKEDMKINELTSTYNFNYMKGVTLTFDTYGMLSELANPTNDGNNQGGDNDFMIMRASADTVVLEGVTSYCRFTLVKANEADITNFFLQGDNFKNFFDINKSASNPYFTSLIYGDNLSCSFKVGANTRTMNFIYQTGDSVATYAADVIINDHGFNLLTPFAYNGKEIYDFTYKNDNQTYFPSHYPAGSIAFTHTSPFPYSKSVNKYKQQTYLMDSYSAQMKLQIFGNLSDITQGKNKGKFDGVELYWDVLEDPKVENSPRISYFSVLVASDDLTIPKDNKFGIASYTALRDDIVSFTDSGLREGTFSSKLNNDANIKKLIAFFNAPEGLTVYEDNNQMYLISTTDSRNWIRFNILYR
jgi:hypothetical protein